MSPELVSALSSGVDVNSLRLLDFVMVRVRRLANLMDRQMKLMLARHFDLTLVEWRCIAFLGEIGPLTAAELCRLADSDKGQVSHTLRGLEERTLVARLTGGTRSVPVELTQAGRTLFENCVAAMRQHEAKLLGRLTSDQRLKLYESLTTLALTIVDELDAADEPAGV